MAAQDKKNTDCFWYLQNGCKKGPSCEFRHSPEALKNEVICKSWLANKCTNPNCSFRHPGTSKTICEYFVAGNCNKGDRCPYSHSTPGWIPQATTTAAPANGDLVNKQALQEKDQELLRLKEEFQKAQEKIKRMEQVATTTSSAPPTTGHKRTNEQITTENKKSIQTSSLSSTKNSKMSINTSILSSSAPKISINTSTLASSKSKNNTKPQENKTDDNQQYKKKPRLEQKDPAPKGKLDFGIKSLSELTKDTEPKKEEKAITSDLKTSNLKKPEQTIYQPKRVNSSESAVATPAPAATTVKNPVASTPGVTSEQLSADRMKNRLAKFGTPAPQPTTDSQKPATPAVPSTVPAATAAVLKSTSSSDLNQPKRQKIDKAAGAPVPATPPPTPMVVVPPSVVAPTPIPPSPKSTSKSILRVGSSLEDEDLELNTNHSSSNLNQVSGLDDFDKELDDLMT